jgi:hypothetical protein
VELSPSLLFLMWGGGVAAGSALVASWRVVGRGYLWLAAGVTAGLAALAAFAGGGTLTWVGAALAGLGGLLGAQPGAATALFVGSAAAQLAAGYESGLQETELLVAGAVLLGGITSEMMLGHWFLVDPTLPRRPLLALDAIAGGGLVAEGTLIVASGVLALSGSILTWVWLALVVTGALLIIGVWLSLREPQYAGVMAATGLSYLAVLVSFGIVVVGRALIAGDL